MPWKVSTFSLSFIAMVYIEKETQSFLSIITVNNGVIVLLHANNGCDVHIIM